MTYTAIIKGIHSHQMRKLRFSEIAAIFNELGYLNPRSNGVAGNILFETEDTDLPGIAESLIQAIEEKMKFDISIMIKDHD